MTEPGEDEPASARWQVARELYEHHAVDADRLATLAACSPRWLAQRITREGWQPAGRAKALHAQLLSIVEGQLGRIADSEESIEKTARATAVVAKVVEDALAFALARHDAAKEGNADGNGRDGTDEATRRDAIYARIEEAARNGFGQGEASPVEALS